MCKIYFTVIIIRIWKRCGFPIVGRYAAIKWTTCACVLLYPAVAVLESCISSICIIVLLRLIKYLLKLLGTAYNCANIVDISHQIPVTLISIERIARLENRSFKEYVVCPACYEFQDCVRMLPNGKQESKTCRHVAYPNHPHASKRKACGALLLKKQTRKSVLAPIKICSVKKSMCRESQVLLRSVNSGENV